MGFHERARIASRTGCGGVRDRDLVVSPPPPSRFTRIHLTQLTNRLTTTLIADDEYNAVISHFDVEGDEEMKYKLLVNEVVKGTALWLHHH